MADPISVAAIAGLIYAGRKLSQPKETYEPAPPQVAQQAAMNRVVEPKNYPIEQVEIPQGQKAAVPNFAEIAPQFRTSGEQLRNRADQYFVDNNRMNNVSPVEKQLVGPGLGVDPNVASYGGYQQLLRVNPENVGAYRLTTLPGRSGPAYDSKGGRRGVVGLVSHNRPEKTAYLPERLPATLGRAQGMSGRTARGEHERTKRTTNRSETGLRTDTLNVAPAKRFVPANTVSQDPTRNKKDGNIEQYAYMNQPQPGIHSYRHGYLESPAAAIGEKRVYGSGYTVEELQKYGFRPDERRGKANRASNPGRMNVRASALNQGGMLTSVRSDTTRVDGRVNPQSAGWTQQYTNTSFHDLNPYKGNENPHASQASLSVAKRQLMNNPLAHHLC
jgi:hypothetical protein